ncbi:MAG: PQQ-binding-like beta-propeller repeat protein, partial [Cyclobacteriaceae bacterium]
MTRTYIITLVFTLLWISHFVSGQILNPKVRWTFKTQGSIRGAAVTDASQIYFGSADGYFYSLNKSTGAIVWKFKTEGAIAGTPALTASLIIFTSRDNLVYALNPKSGQLVWKFRMQPIMDAYTSWEYFVSTPVTSGNRVFVGSGDGNLYALDLGNGKEVWKFKTNGRIRATPLITAKTIYQPSNDGVVYVLNEDNGKLLWKFETDGASLDSRKFGFDRNCIFAQPQLKDSILVIASRDGKTYGVDIYSHQEKWRFTYGTTWAMSATLDADLVYIGWSTNNHFCALDVKTGTEKWKFIAKSVVYTKPLVLERDVIVGSGDEHVYALDKKTGQKRWEYKLSNPVFSSPIFDDDILYFGCDDGNMYALEEGVKPYKAVYLPVSSRYDFTVDPKITPYLKSKGFAQLDSASITKFLNDRIRDQAPSVLVMAFDYIPENLIGEAPENGIFRKYLEAGGKVIWFGNVPNPYVIDENGKISMSVAKGNRLLGDRK